MSTNLRFVKMHGAGNDFVVVDGRDLERPLGATRIAALCHRRTGVGADGVIAVVPAAGRDFRMIYWNADGGEAEMCGNGARCAVEFAARKGLHDGNCRFATASGDLSGTRHAPGDVEVSLPPWRDLALHVEVANSPWDDHHLCNTGVPHLVVPVDDLDAVPLAEWGPRLRGDAVFGPAGGNVNWVAPTAQTDRFALRTYERGVEAETLACGTGASAAAVILCRLGRARSPVTIRTRGGDELVVAVNENARGLRLRGPAVAAFEGEVTIDD